ncbi:peptide-methionine (S)-S-oxide reductase MsrA [Natronorubrum thiooxidans]|uniref:peptide-methionine (S)-S-oxide reductase n=1 Tax=Natronorubrum thiooxidans TaxID=308853 RepID=A0A1N7E0T0_9EURY|nr:peptide-methionine (S)-S-oxide reductase MsrA [Natronorubrum thiooxidans]SIR81674.1 peptide-methionine (S)-S-oxide reductase [Natronorubrum thiooxidans]
MEESDPSVTEFSLLEQQGDTPSPSETETATFGMGCFWGPDARFGAMEGVVRTRVGYAGGTTPNPRYYSLGDHTEVVQVVYDPGTVTYDELLEDCWANHDWTSTAHKRQYRGVILTHDDHQHEVATRQRTALEEQTGQSAETAIERLEQLFLAEDYHQKYELRSTPVVGDELEAQYGDAFVDSTVVARLNGFVAGHGTPAQRNEVLARLNLPPRLLAELRRRF